MGKMYGYCRVSTQKQDLQRQIDNIKKVYPNIDAWYTDKCTGATMQRPNFELLCKAVDKDVKNGKHVTIVFDSVSRMSRNAVEGVEQYFKWLNKGVSLIFLNEHYIDTDTYKAAEQTSIPETGNEIADIYINATNQVLMLLAKRQIEIAFEQADKERVDISTRVKEGMRTKKEQAAEQGVTISYGAKEGVKLTTKKSIAAKEKILEHSKDFNGSLSDADCIQLTGISRNSYYKYKHELNELKNAGLITQSGGGKTKNK